MDMLDAECGYKSGRYGHHHLWALIRECPRRAQKAASLPPADLVAGIPGGRNYVSFEWTHGDLPLEINVDAIDGTAAYLAADAFGCGPSTARAIVREGGLHLYAAMLEDGMRQAGKVMASFVLALQDARHQDHGLYVFGDHLMESGRVEYHRALHDLAQAIRDGWPGWSATGVQLLEIPEREHA